MTAVTLSPPLRRGDVPREGARLPAWVPPPAAVHPPRHGPVRIPTQAPTQAPGRGSVHGRRHVPIRAPLDDHPRPGTSSPPRLTQRGRLALLLLLVLPVIVVGAVLVRAPATASTQDASTAAAPVAERFTVRPGQTLWQIAQRTVPTADPRATIQRIKEMNGLSSSFVQAGQVLLVPGR